MQTKELVGTQPTLKERIIDNILKRNERYKKAFVVCLSALTTLGLHYEYIYRLKTSVCEPIVPTYPTKR